MKSIDLTGQTFNNLTVIGIGEGKVRTKKYWKCKCSCGNITNVETSKLKSLSTLSCGCIRGKKQTQDLTGKTFGYLTVLSKSYTKKGRIYWLCKCVCNKEVIKQGKLLKMGSITSCGCMKNKNKIKDLTNKKFNELTVLSRYEKENKRNYWTCLCSCGKTVILTSKQLLSGTRKSCGCLVHKPAINRKNLINKKFGELTVLSYSHTEGKKVYWTCLCSCGNIKTVYSSYLIQGETRTCGTCHLTSSLKEKEVLSFVQNIYKGNIKANDREIINPKELDIYIPEKNFAIEFNGLYWHSEAQNKKQMYHLHKTKLCQAKGIRLLHIYENEWRDKKEIVKSIIASALGIYERKIYARKCEVKEVTDKEAVRKIFNENHLQGAISKYQKALGLYYNNELVQCCLFGKQNFGRNNDIELYRMVTLKNTQVLGGFSKLMKHCSYSSVISYVSLRTFDAKGYYNSGWKLESISNPSFCITDGVNTYSRHLFKKERCLKMFDNVTPEMTEREMCLRNNYYRIWDCGTYKVRYTVDKICFSI